MTRRPKYAQVTDSNHKIVPEFIRAIGGTFAGYQLDCMDISKRGGRRTDWVMSIGPVNVFVEVKTPAAYASKDHGMTPGEQAFFETWPGRKAIVYDYDSIRDLVVQIVDELERA